jgi:peptidoglycan/LPS O-acetylase OafA/YrhL
VGGFVPRKIDLGEALAAVGAVLLLVALFLEWFNGFTGWEAFESLDLVLALLALAVIACALSLSDWLDSRLLAPLGLLLLFIVVVQLVEPPPGFGDEDPSTGAWLALAGAGLVLIGGALRVARISVTVNLGERDMRRQRVAAVDRRTAAAPGAAAAPPAPPPPRDEPTQATQPFSALDAPPAAEDR